MAVSDISTLQIKVETKGITQAVKALDKLGEAAEKTEKKVKQLGTQVLQTSGEIAGSTGATTALTSAILLLNANLGRLMTQTIQQTQAQRQSNDAMRDAHAAARGLTGSLGMLWLTYGNLIPMMTGAAMGAAFKQILTQGMAFEQIMTEIGVKGQETTETMNKARQSVLDLGQGVYGPQQVAGALETLVLAGLKAEDAIAGIGPALNLATVGGTTIEKAAYTLVQVGTAMGYTSDSFGLVGDKIAKTAAVSMSSVESLSEAFKSASSVGVVYGVTLNDLGVQLAALSNLGIQGTAAGTAVKNFYKELDSDTKKVTGTLKKLGVDVDSLKIGDKFKDINSIMAILSDALDKAGDKGGKAMQALSNERGMRNFAALLQLYRKGIDETGESLSDLHKKIADSAGYTAVAAARIALTSQNQVTSTLNTLKTSFVETFDEMAPHVNVVAHELKKIFQSTEFKNGLKEIATNFGYFLVELVKAIPLIIEAGKAFLVFKAGMVAAAATQGIVTGIKSVTTALVMLDGMIAGTTATSVGLAAVFPPLAAVLGVAAAAWWLYNHNKDEALDTSTVDAAAASNAELIANLEKEANRLDVANKNLRENISLKKAAEKTSRDLALAEMVARNTKAEADAKTQAEGKLKFFKDDNYSGAEISNIINGANEGKFRNSTLKQVKEYQEAVDLWKKAQAESVSSVKAFNDTFDKLQKKSQENQELTDAKMEAEAKKARERAELMAKLAGNPDITTPDKPKPNAHANKIAAEALELDRLTASYTAKADAVEQYAVSGALVMANTRQAIVDTNNKVKGYYTEKEYLMMKDKALAADQAKFEQTKANMLSESMSKVNEIVNRGIVQRAAENLEGYKTMGMQEKLMAVTAIKIGLIGKEAEAMRALGREADKQLATEAAIQKLTTATASSEQRTQGLLDEAEAIKEYGKAGKQTAVQMAEAEITKLKLVDGSAKAEVAARREAAAMEDLAKAYNNLAKFNDKFAKKDRVNDVVGMPGVFGSNTAKVTADRLNGEDEIRANEDRASDAVTAAEKLGNPEALKKAKALFEEVKKESKKASDAIKKDFNIKIQVAGLKDLSNAFGSLAKSVRTMGPGMERTGEALDGLSTGFTRLAEIREKDGISEAERMEGQIGAYGDMAQASAGFFSENSKGYRVMMGVSKAFHAAEMAMNLARIISGVAAGAAQMFAQSGWGGFAGVAAMGVVMAGLGYAMSGSSSKGGMKAEDVQKEQGTGSVFGDSSAKSESISKSIDRLKDNSSVMLPLTQGMLAALQGIEASMNGLTNLVVRTDGVVNGTNMGIQTGTLARSTGNSGVSTLLGMNAKGGAVMGAAMGSVLPGIGTLIGGALGAVAGWVGSKIARLWGSTKQNIVDSGLQFGGNVASLQAGNGFNQYASVDTTKKSAFGLKKKTTNSVQTQGLNAELSAQFGLIFSNLEDTLKMAAPALGKSASEIENSINNMVLSTTKVSLKDLKGEELQQAINGVISKSMDEIAQKAFPQMDAFRQVGEGYAETVIRVASGIEQANLAMEQLGIAAISYTDVVNKQGDVAAEMVKQSIGAKEGLTGVNSIIQNMTGTVGELTEVYRELNNIRKSMNLMGLQGNNLNVNLIKGAGGVSELSSALESYQDKFFTDSEKSAIMLKSVGLEFKQLGLKLPESKEALRKLITQVSAIGSENSDKLAGKLLVLADAYAEATEAAEQARADQIDGLKSSLDAMKEFAQSIREFRESLLLGDLSNMTPEEKFAEAKAQYDATLQKAMSGDKAAQENMTGIAQAFLEASRVVNASSVGYDQSFQKVQDDLKGLEAYAGNQVSEIQRQIDALEKQTSLLESLNATANSILNGITGSGATPVGSVPVIMPEPVVVGNNDDVVEELRRQRDEAAAQAAAVAKRLEELAAVTMEAGARMAQDVVEGYSETTYDRYWRYRTDKYMEYER